MVIKNFGGGGGGKQGALWSRANGEYPVIRVIITITKLSNLIGYQLP